MEENAICNPAPLLIELYGIETQYTCYREKGCGMLLIELYGIETAPKRRGARHRGGLLIELYGIETN